MIKYHLMVSVGNPDYDVELGNEAYLIVGKFLGDSAADCIDQMFTKFGKVIEKCWIGCGKLQEACVITRIDTTLCPAWEKYFKES